MAPPGPLWRAFGARASRTAGSRWCKRRTVLKFTCPGARARPPGGTTGRPARSRDHPGRNPNDGHFRGQNLYNFGMDLTLFLGVLLGPCRGTAATQDQRGRRCFLVPSGGTCPGRFSMRKRVTVIKFTVHLLPNWVPKDVHFGRPSGRHGGCQGRYFGDHFGCHFGRHLDSFWMSFWRPWRGPCWGGSGHLWQGSPSHVLQNMVFRLGAVASLGNRPKAQKMGSQNHGKKGV